MVTMVLQRFGVLACMITSIVVLAAIWEFHGLESWFRPLKIATLDRKKQWSFRNNATFLPNTTTTVPNTTATASVVAWCILDSNNTWFFQHFPHAAQSLFPCWSYFELMRQSYPTVTCGFWFRNWSLPPQGGHWQRSLIKAMGCLETNHTLPASILDHHHQQQQVHHLSHRIDLVGGFASQDANNNTVHDVHWFDRPQDAWNLRDRVLQYYNFTVRSLVTSSNPKQLRIGFVQRQTWSKRLILNMPQIITALQKVFPQAVITNTTLSGMNLGEQAHYFATHDVIIAAHGAALTNSAFLQPGSLVVQLYPKHYYPIFFFEPLIQQVQSHPYAWYDGYPKDPILDHMLHIPNRFQNRAANMRPPVHEIVAMVVNATKEIGIFVQ